jgi:hypothetical protein
VVLLYDNYYFIDDMFGKTVFPDDTNDETSGSGHGFNEASGSGDELSGYEINKSLVDGPHEPENPVGDDAIVHDDDPEYDNAYSKLFIGECF